MPFCQKCGKEHKEGAAFCSGCGAALGKNGVKSTIPTASPRKEGGRTKILKRACIAIVCILILCGVGYFFLNFASGDLSQQIANIKYDHHILGPSPLVFEKGYSVKIDNPNFQKILNPSVITLRENAHVLYGQDFAYPQVFILEKGASVAFDPGGSSNVLNDCAFIMHKNSYVSIRNMEMKGECIFLSKEGGNISIYNCDTRGMPMTFGGEKVQKIEISETKNLYIGFIGGMASNDKRIKLSNNTIRGTDSRPWPPNMTIEDAEKELIDSLIVRK